jgi:hypothetical protein
MGVGERPQPDETVSVPVRANQNALDVFRHPFAYAV